MRARFPTRTLVLMVLTLLAFGWMYWQTHLNAPPPPQHKATPPVQIIAVPLDGGREALERALSAALAADAGPDSPGGDR